VESERDSYSLFGAPERPEAGEAVVLGWGEVMARAQTIVLLTGLVLAPVIADGFCGFYVAQADAKLFNQASQVVLVRDGDRTTITMVNDYQGDPSEFAIVVPVPSVIQKEDVRVLDRSNVEAVDAYTAPRLVEYEDDDPCYKPPPMSWRRRYPMPEMAAEKSSYDDDSVERGYGVKIQAQYTVGEYDIVVLSATQSTGLQRYLEHEGYKIPEGATGVLESYIQQNMNFFLAKVNLKAHQATERPFLSPLQVTSTSPKYMLPIRLGTVNANGPQDLLIYAISQKGRVEPTNYRLTRLPTDLDVPEYVKTTFGPFYKDLFAQQVKKQGMQTVFLEYGWPLAVNCDPCSADPVRADQLRELGASWVQEQYGYHQQNTYLTRLHVRYDRDHFPEDLVFQETADQSTFQGRYAIHHPFNGDTSCPAGRTYETALAARQSQEADTLAALTGWDPASIRKNIPIRQSAVRPKEPPRPPPSWWDGVK
jgi:hypothetical protein